MRKFLPFLLVALSSLAWGQGSCVLFPSTLTTGAALTDAQSFVCSKGTAANSCVSGVNAIAAFSDESLGGSFALTQPIGADSTGNTYVCVAPGTYEICTTSPRAGGPYCWNQQFWAVSTGTNAPGTPILSLSPTSLTFASLAVNASASLSATMTNSGSVAAVINSITASGDFAQTNTCGGILAAGANCVIAVTFTPTAAGTRTGTLSVVSNASPTAQTVSLTGTGTVNPITLSSLAIAPTNPTVSIGQTQQFNTTGTFSDSSTKTLTSTTSWNAAGGGGGASWALVNSSVPHYFTAASGTCAAISVTSGHLLVVTMVTSITSSTLGVSDSAVNSWSSTTAVSSSNKKAQFFYALAGSSVSDTITGTSSNATATTQMACFEFSGNAAASVLDVQGGQGAPSSTNAMTTGNFTTTGSSDLIIGIFADNATGPFPAGNGYTQIGTQNGYAFLAEDQAPVAAGTYAATATDTVTSANWVAAAAAFKGSASSPIASITSSGLATGLVAGTSTITASAAHLVQGTSQATASSVSSIAIPFTGPQNSGSANLIIIGWDAATGSVSGVTDLAGNSYSQVANSLTQGNSESQVVYIATNISAFGNSASPNVVTVNFAAAVASPDVRILEYAGVAASTPIDIAGAGNGSSAIASASATTTNANDIGVCGTTTAGSVQSVVSPFTLELLSGANGSAQDLSVFATGSQTGSANLSASANWAMSCVWLKSVSATTNLTVSAASAANQFYVNASTGADTNNCTASNTACATLGGVDGKVTLGASGAVVNVAAGNYTGFTETANGTSTQRILYNCTAKWQCFITGFSQIQGNFVDVENFDITNPNGGSAIYMGVNLVSATNNGLFDSIQFNRIHDVGNNCTTGSFGGAVGMYNVAHDDTINANIIDNIGVMGGCVNANNFKIPHGIYVQGYHNIITNNLISNAGGYGIQLYHNSCNNEVANNTVFHNYSGGIVVGGDPDGNAPCGTSTGDDFNAINNNLVVRNGWGCGVYAAGNAGTAQVGIQFYNLGTAATHNMAADNYLASNWSGAGAGCTATAGTNNFVRAVDGNGVNCNGVNNCTNTQLLGSNLNSTIYTNLFVNYTDNGAYSTTLLNGTVGDYHEVTTSPSANRGAANTTCAASPGYSPCEPLLDYDGNPRPVGLYDIGAYELQQ